MRFNTCSLLFLDCLFWIERDPPVFVSAAGTGSPKQNSTRLVAASVALFLVAMRAGYSGTMVASLTGE